MHKRGLVQVRAGFTLLEVMVAILLTAAMAGNLARIMCLMVEPEIKDLEEFISFCFKSRNRVFPFSLF